MGDLRYLGALLATAFKASVALRAAFLLQIGFMALNNLLYFAIWWIMLRRFPSVGGYTIEDMEVLFGVCATAFGVAVLLCGGMFELGRHIGDGDLDALLSQPRHPLVRLLGSHSMASGYGDIASGLLLIALAGHARLADVLPLLFAIALSACALVSSCVVFQSAVFWLGRVERLSRMLTEFVVMLASQPPTLFSSGMKLLLFTLVPAGLVGHVPAQLVRHFHFGLAALAFEATLLYALFAVFVFERGLRRYASGSRLGVWA
jgi:ABC-2 type transport system permease protein